MIAYEELNEAIYVPDGTEPGEFFNQIFTDCGFNDGDLRKFVAGISDLYYTHLFPLLTLQELETGKPGPDTYTLGFVAGLGLGCKLALDGKLEIK